MKKLSWFNKIVFFFNILFALLLSVSFLAPFVSVKTIPFLSILSLSVSLLVLVNLLFCAYWLLQRNKRLFVSGTLLVLGYFIFGSFFKLNFTSEEVSSDELKVMSYNARGFNKFNWSNDKSLGDKIIDFVSQESPDIICIQEHSRIWHHKLKQFKYRSETPYSAPKSVQAIFSKYPIISKGSLDLPKTVNNIIYADILYRKDTIRVYNIHLQSFSIDPNPETIVEEQSDKLLKRLTNTFKKQQEQASIFAKHRKESPYKSIVCGDFNNTQFSNVYRVIKDDMKDTYVEKGAGFGSTYNYRYYPLRIDFILTDKRFKVVRHKNYDVALSDHFPVMSSLRTNK